MKKRIGNDIQFTWHIYRKDGDTQVPESFANKEVEVKLISPLQRTVTIENVTIATGVVTFTFRGKHQVTLGNYVAVLQENRGENGMVTLDVVNAVTLVPHSYMEEDGDDGDIIEATSVELDSEIGQGIDAYTKAETDALLEGKQDTINDLATIRSGAQAGSTAVQPSGLAPVATSGSYNDLSDKPDLSAFITKSVNDLTNYYLKSETYTKNEVLQLIGTIQQFHYEVYPTLPQTAASNVLYLIGPIGAGADKYEEYVYANNDWTKIGDTSIDLSGYVTTQALNTALADYVTSSALSTTLANYYNKTEVDGLFAGKENVMPITTATGATLSAVVGNYYRLDNVGTLAITLPTIVGATKLQAITFLLACGSSALVTFAPQGSETILYQEDFALEADTTYEVTALWNGSEWTLSRVIYE